MRERHSTAQPLYSKRVLRGKELNLARYLVIMFRNLVQQSDLGGSTCCRIMIYLGSCGASQAASELIAQATQADCELR